MDHDAEARIDLALVKRVLLQDDRQAFEQLLRRHQGLVRVQLRRLCDGDAALADDLAQEVFLLVWRKLSSFRGDARFSTWLFRVAHNCFLQARRRNTTVPVQASPADEASEILQIDSDDSPGLQVDLQRALQCLPEGERMVMLYHAQMGMSHEETAQITGFPLGTVKTHALRGKVRMRAWLDAYQSGRTTGADP
jgi:RNA polymerase sigma factor (sigma-70 family)